jgi:hypothetical protein
MLKNNFILFCYALFIMGCTKESPYVSEDIINEIKAIYSPSKYMHIAFVYNSDIYYLKDGQSTPKRLTFSPQISKTKIRISYKHNKIAFLRNDVIPTIIDTSGNVISELTQYNGVKQMDWSNNDSALYMLINNTFVFYGTKINIPQLTIPNDIPVNVGATIISASISSKNDIAYIIGYSDLYGAKKRLIVKSSNGTEILNSNSEDKYMQYVCFSGNASDFVVGYTDYNSSENLFIKISLFSDLKKYPKQTLESSSSCFYITPNYRSDINAIVTTYKNSSTSNATIIFREIGMDNDLLLNDFSSSNNNLIVNWK